jgi:hypothetical protein
MRLALEEWDRTIDRMIESFEKDTDFEPGLKRDAEFVYSSEDAVTQQRELANFKVTPSDYLYNARGDTSLTHAYLAIEVLEEYNEEQAKEQTKRLLERISPTAKKQPSTAKAILAALRRISRENPDAAATLKRIRGDK